MFNWTGAWQLSVLLKGTVFSEVVPVVKNLPANAGDITDSGSILGSGRSPGGGHGNPLQCSYLENPMERGAWRATVHAVAKHRTRPKDLVCTHAHCREEQMFLKSQNLRKKVHFLFGGSKENGAGRGRGADRTCVTEPVFSSRLPGLTITFTTC